ncbi:hemin-degrading factor [Pseudotabrizicola alkalilacus]|uniref:Hemin-degrading factor n=1 Tax=Pseudotabrizicola alkalilacus TaxID=2305252 RepID=A0A411Z0V5_9RHOB|nr:ChuX/HutX family heme-like substrate-binding protein [Pseudotabrizicola alkalilacus]RGP36709.1 hemin-degrading factor [Pseudotabrizicola alkalilacus]
MLLSPDVIARITHARTEHPKLRERDLAAAIGLSEAQLVAAEAGASATRIVADPARLMPHVCQLGDVMALTRNESAVHERRGVYSGFHSGAHASMVLGDEIDLRIFPRHWVHGFAITRETEQGVKRSIQVFDAAGDAVHKVHLGADSDIAAFDAAVADLGLPADAPFEIIARATPEPARIDADRIDALRSEWAQMTDTHQFLALVRRLKMNRLGANRAVGPQFARQLPVEAVSWALERSAADALKIMIFVGNEGCIQIHSGLVHRIAPMGPWQNVLDPRFNLHLRADHIAEVWLVSKPTKRGPAVSVEAFDAEGRLILQMFGKRAEADTDTRGWDRMTESLAAEVLA